MIFPKILSQNQNSLLGETSLFSVVLDQILSSRELNRDLARISEWAFQWKMSSNPDPSKQAVEVYFSVRHNPANAPPLSFNNTNIETNECQKHLGLTLDSKLSFKHHLDEKIKKANKGIGLINRLRKYVRFIYCKQRFSWYIFAKSINKANTFAGLFDF